MTLHIYFGTCAQGRTFKSSVERPVLCGIVFLCQDRLLPAWQLLPLACILLLSEQCKVNNRIALNNQSLLELMFDNDAGEFIDNVEPRAKNVWVL